MAWWHRRPRRLTIAQLMRQEGVPLLLAARAKTLGWLGASDIDIDTLISPNELGADYGAEVLAAALRLLPLFDGVPTANLPAVWRAAFPYLTPLEVIESIGWPTIAQAIARARAAAGY